ncbi:hypothetical protein F5Y17DRAFT_122830 [Xylariaceae sp. FL0594]|nr:hypothetical protein F5Y17DRAFT_122830 [Xylariaceae sp. FL0594]
MSDYEKEAPTGDIADDSYASRDNDNVPVVSDKVEVEDPIDDAQADSDAQLDRDEKEAIDESNIVDERTRGAAKPAGTYREPTDEEGLPENDGTSSTDQA